MKKKSLITCIVVTISAILLLLNVFQVLGDAEIELNSPAELDKDGSQQQVARVPEVNLEQESSLKYVRVIAAQSLGPIPNAKVELEFHGKTATGITDVNGVFHVEPKISFAQVKRINVAAAGFVNAAIQPLETSADTIIIELERERRGRFLHIALSPGVEYEAGRCVVTLRRSGAPGKDATAQETRICEFSDFPLVVESKFEHCDVSVDLPNYVRASSSKIRVPISFANEPKAKVVLNPTRGGEVFGWFLPGDLEIPAGAVRALARVESGWYETAESLSRPVWTERELRRALQSRLVDIDVDAEGLWNFRIRGLAPGEYEISGVGYRTFTLSQTEKVSILGEEVVGPIKLEFPRGGSLKVKMIGDVADCIDSIGLRKKNTKSRNSRSGKRFPRVYYGQVKNRQAEFPIVALGEYSVTLHAPITPVRRYKEMPEVVFSKLKGFCMQVLNLIWNEQTVHIERIEELAIEVDLKRMLELHKNWQNRIGIKEISHGVRHGFKNGQLGVLRPEDVAGMPETSPKKVESRFLRIERLLSLLIDRDLPWLRKNVECDSGELQPLLSRIQKLAQERQLEDLLKEILD